MIRTVIAFPSPEALERVSGVMERNGIPVRFRCRTGSQAVRAIRKMGGGVVVCAYKLPDMTAEKLFEELGEDAFLLVIGKLNLLDRLEQKNIFKAAAPVKTDVLIRTVNELLQADEQRSRSVLPRRTPEEQELIHRAALALMERGMDENEARRFLQHRSMETSSKMSDVAERILSEETEKDNRP